MSAKIVVNLASGGNVGETSYMVRLSNAKDGGKPAVSSVHYTPKTQGAGQPFPDTASGIQAFVQNQWSGTDYTKVEGGSRVKNALTGKNSRNYVVCVGNVVNFKGILDTGVYRAGDKAWQFVIDLIANSVQKANEEEFISPELRKLFEAWQYFDWKDRWKYTKWLLSECMQGRITMEEALYEMSKFSDEEYKKPRSQPTDSYKVLKEVQKVITECLGTMEAREESLQEGFLDTLKGKIKQKLGNAQQVANWMENFKNKNARNTPNLLAVLLVQGTLDKILGDEDLNMAELFKGVFGSDVRFGQIKQALNGADSGLKPIGQILAQMYNAGAKLNLNSKSTDEQISKGLNLQGYVGKVASTIQNTPFGKAAAEIDKKLASGASLGGAQRKGKVADISTDPLSSLTPQQQNFVNDFVAEGDYSSRIDSLFGSWSITR